MNRYAAVAVVALLVGCGGSNSSSVSAPRPTPTMRSSPTPTPTMTPPNTADWPTFDGNPSRSAWLYNDTSISPQNVLQLRRRWVTTFGAIADSTPIYVAHPQGRSTAMLYQTDRAGTTYGIDAPTGRIVWRFATVGPKWTQATPVLDPSGSAIYAPGVDGYVHKLDALTGTQLSAPGFPAQITLIPHSEADSSPLNVANGYLYAATSGYIGDRPPYVGRVVTVRLSDGKTNIFNALCSDIRELQQPYQCSSQRAGSWSRSGVVVDPDPSMKGRVYFATGNGTYDPNNHDYADSVIALHPDGSTVADSFTPTNYQELQDRDLDLGCTAPAMLPRIAGSRTPLMAVQGGKEGILYLLDREHLGGVGGELQSIQRPREVFSTPAVWVDPSGVTWVFVGRSGGMEAWTVVTDPQGRSQLKATWTARVGGSSAVATNGLVIMVTSGALYALDSQTGRVLWSSKLTSAGGTVGRIHWESPIVVNGGIYVSDGSSHLTAYTINGK